MWTKAIGDVTVEVEAGATVIRVTNDVLYLDYSQLENLGKIIEAANDGGEWDGPYFVYDDVRDFSYEKAAEILLRKEVVFVGMGQEGYARTRLIVGCNDVFAWATADGEEIPAYSLEELYNLYEKDGFWGIVRWCAIRRNMKPQKPVITKMKTAGKWDEIMESLPENKWGE